MQAGPARADIHPHKINCAPAEPVQAGPTEANTAAKLRTRTKPGKAKCITKDKVCERQKTCGQAKAPTLVSYM